MEMICLDTNILIAHKRAKKADKDKTFLYHLTAFSISVRYLHICAPCRQRVADLLRIKDCRAATLCRQLFQNLINVIN